MGHLVTVLAIIGGVLAAALSNQIADEFKAWTPWLTRRLIERWVSKLPTGVQDRDGEDIRNRYTEEWTRLVEDTPGQVGKLVEALSLFKASRELKRRVESSTVDVDNQIADLYRSIYVEHNSLREQVVAWEWQLFDLQMHDTTKQQSIGAEHHRKLLEQVGANLQLARTSAKRFEEEVRCLLAIGGPYMKLGRRQFNKVARRLTDY